MLGCGTLSLKRCWRGEDCSRSYNRPRLAFFCAERRFQRKSWNEVGRRGLHRKAVRSAISGSLPSRWSGLAFFDRLDFCVWKSSQGRWKRRVDGRQPVPGLSAHWNCGNSACTSIVLRAFVFGARLCYAFPTLTLLSTPRRSPLPPRTLTSSPREPTLERSRAFIPTTPLAPPDPPLSQPQPAQGPQPALGHPRPL